MESPPVGRNGLRWVKGRIRLHTPMMVSAGQVSYPLLQREASVLDGMDLSGLQAARAPINSPIVQMESTGPAYPFYIL